MKTVFRQLGPYEIIRAIGHGMAGSVFLARDVRTELNVALKLVPHGTENEDLEIIAAERRGAELQKQLSLASAHVPTVFEHGDHESGYYVAMEYLDGENLSNAISRGPLSPGQATMVAIELCRFLEEAHRFEAVMDDRECRSLVHGDLTPRNVRITSDGKVKVLDFGIAKALSLSRKATRNDFGTLWYLSPERLESGVVDEYADFWAVGVILFEMIYSARPFQAGDTRRLEKLILSRTPPRHQASCPRGLQAIVTKLLAPNPDQRYAAAQAIREDIERFNAGTPTEAEREGWGSFEGESAAVDEPQTRRTRPVQDIAADEEQTRRTVRPEGSPQAAPARRRAPSPYLRRFVLVVVLFIAVIIANEFWIRSEAVQATSAVPRLELQQLDEAWNQHDDLASRAYLHLATRTLGNSLVQRTSLLADRIMANYRTALPTVREAQWQSARDALARAAAAAPGDRQIRAALRYCEGHLRRINGEAKIARRKAADAQQDLTEAVSAFREAAELRPEWPDPFLGLARTFIYGLQDVDRAADALRQAERRGYSFGERESVQLADGYRLRGDTLVRNANELRGMPQEKDYLQRAVDAYRESLMRYLTVSDLPKVGTDLRLVQQALNRTEKKLSDLLQPEQLPTFFRDATQPPVPSGPATPPAEPQPQ